MNTKPWSNFALSNKKQWNEIAKLELHGEDAFEKLSIVKGKLKIFPYYDKTDVAQADSFDLLPSGNPFYGSKTWFSCPLVVVKNAAQANAIALEHLRCGADGILFQLEGDVSIADLLNEIQLPHCFTAFKGNFSPQWVNDLFQHMKKFFEGHSIPGIVFSNGASAYSAIESSHFSEFQTFRTYGLRVERKATAEDTIVDALLNAVRTVEMLTQQRVPVETAFRQLAFSLTIEKDFFQEIATLKVMRYLLRLVAHAYGVKEYQPCLHAHSAAWVNTAYQPHGNLLKGTSAGLAALFGGCDVLTVEPEEVGNPLLERMARNVSLLFREESHLARVADPVAGSYYLENLTRAMAQTCWSSFQTHATQL